MDYRDLWTDDPDLSPQSGYQKRLFQVIEAYATRHADAVTTVSPGWQRHLKSRFSGTTKSDRFFLIRNGHNLDKFTFEYHNGPHYDGRLHIHFNGTLQILAKTTSVLDALYKLRSDDIRGGTLPIVTFTGIDDLFMKEIRSRNLEDIILDVGYMTYYQSIMYSLSCDVLLIIVNNDNPSRWGTIPRKTYEYMALGRHILAVVPFESDVRELLKEYGNATVCDVDDPDDICNALMKLITLHGEHKLNTNLDVGKREMALEKYSMEHHTRQLISLIEALPKKK
jgi:glycosyltransferase involved in cell wall biosynthesis